MSSLQISQGSFRLNDTRVLTLNDVSIATGQSWAFIGANGSGKSVYSAENHLIPKGKIFDTLKNHTNENYLIPIAVLM